MLDSENLKILITGASGFIGAYFMDFFYMQGYDVVGIIRDEGKIRKGFRYIVCNLAEGINLEEKFDVIIHCAAQLDKDPVGMEEYVKGNIILTQQILNFARKANVNRIINLGGVRSFGRIKEKIISESTPMFDPGYYGVTKWVAERLLLDSEINTISLILPGIVGKNGHTPWLMRVSRDLLENKPIDCYEKDAMFNNILYVGTLAEVVHNILGSEIEKNEKILLGSRDPIRKFDVLCHLRQGLGSSSEIRIKDSTDNSFYIDVSKAKKMNIVLPTVEEELDKLIQEINYTR